MDKIFLSIGRLRDLPYFFGEFYFLGYDRVKIVLCAYLGFRCHRENLAEM